MQFDPDSDIWQSTVSDLNKLQAFVRDACPSSWLECGEELHDAAELIWANADHGFRRGVTLNAELHPRGEPKSISSVSRTYTLLAGFALENVMKGHLVLADPSLVNRGVLSDDLKSHDILGIAAKIQCLRLSNEERMFCGNVSKAIPYWGRYPIPIKKEHLVPEVGMNEKLRHAFLGLFERLAHRLYWAVRDGWDSGVGPKTIKIRSTRYGDSIDPKEPLF